MQAQLHELLVGLKSPDNATRNVAERRFTELLAAESASVLTSLAQLTLRSSDAAACEHAAVLLRSQLARKQAGKEWLEALGLQESAQLREAMFERLSLAPSFGVKRQVAYIIAQMARMSFVKHNDQEFDVWPGLLDGLLTLCEQDSPHAESSVVALRCLQEVMQVASSKLVDPDVRQRVQQTLCKVIQNPPGSSAIASAESFKTMSVLFRLVEEEEAEAFASAVECAVDSLRKLVSSEKALLLWLESMIDVILAQAKLLHDMKIGAKIVSYMTELEKNAAQHEAEDVQKQSIEVCLQIIVGLPSAIKENVEIVKSLLDVGIRWTMVHCSDEDDEVLVIDPVSSEEGLFGAGFRLLYVICENLGEDRVVPLLFPLIQQLLSNEGDWRRHRCGLTALNCMAYSSGRRIYENLQEVLNKISPFLTNAGVDIRVRHIALDVLSTLLYTYSDVSSMIPEGDDFEDVREQGIQHNVQHLHGEFILGCLATILEPPKQNDFAHWSFTSKAVLSLAYYAQGCDDGCGTDIMPDGAERQLLDRILQIIEVSGVIQSQQIQQNGYTYTEGMIDVADVQSSCIQAISALAKSLGNHFAPYYDTFMPVTKRIYQHASQADSPSDPTQTRGKETSAWATKQRALIGRAMDTMASIGGAVGPEMFKNDATFLMQMLMQYMERRWSNGDNERDEQVAKLITNICVVMDESVDEQVLNAFLPKFVEFAQRPHYHKVEGEELEKLENEPEGEGVEDDGDELEEEDNTKQYVLTEDEEVLCIDTFIMKQKVSVIEMMHNLVQHLGHKLMPWAGTLCTCLVDILRGGSVSVPDMQLHAVFAIGALVVAISKFLIELGASVTAQQKEFAQKVFDQSLEAILTTAIELFTNAIMEDEQNLKEFELGVEMGDEDDQSALLINSTVNQLPDIFRAAFESGGMSDNDIDRILAKDYSREKYPPAFGIEDMNALNNVMLTIRELMQESIERPRGKPWWKEAHNRETLDSLAESVGMLIKIHGEKALPSFAETMLPMAKTFLEDSGNEKIKGLDSIGLFLFDDVIENGGQQAQQLIPVVMPFMLKHARAEDNILRQAAVFGLGVCVQHGGEVVDQYLQDIAQILIEVIERPGSRDRNKASATDNAISSVFKLVLFKNREDLLPRLISYLPCKADPIEARTVHHRLVAILDKLDPALQEGAKKALNEALELQAKLDAKGIDKAVAVLSEQTKQAISRMN